MAAVRESSVEMTNAAETHFFLEIDRYHRSEAAAEKLLLASLKRLEPSLTPHQLRNATYTLGKANHSFGDLRKVVRETGTVESLWNVICGTEPFFPPVFDMATTSAGIKLKAEIAGFEAEFCGPSRVAPIEKELCGDILFFRRAVCGHSGEVAFEDATRYFRAYVFACTSLVEAFLNRPVLFLMKAGNESKALEELQKPSDFETRIELWVATFGQDPIADLKRSVSWDHFQQLRKLRNRFIHATEPHLGVEIQSLALGLNLVREGVGGFMRRLREMQRLPAPPFIERLESAPQVRFRPKKGEPVRRTN